MQRVLHLQDDTGSIRICLWGDLAKDFRASVGDSVRVTNVTSNHFMDTVSLSSTGWTRVYKVPVHHLQAVPVLLGQPC